jgi:hypothetical protein
MNTMSPHGKALLKALGGNSSMARATPAAVKRWGLDQPDSIASVLPEEFLARVLLIPDDAMKLPESQLESQGMVSRQDRRVRIQFWHEYEKAAKERRQMNLQTIVEHTGVPSWDGYAEKLYLNPSLFAWLMQPPAGYRLQMEEAQEIGLKRLTDIMELPIMDSAGKVNVAVAMLILQAFKLVDQRVHGAITQRMVSVNLHGAEPPPAAKLDMDAVEKRIKELEAQLGHGGSSEKSTVPGTTEVIDVESTLIEKGPSDGNGIES